MGIKVQQALLCLNQKYQILWLDWMTVSLKNCLDGWIGVFDFFFLICVSGIDCFKHLLAMTLREDFEMGKKQRKISIEDENDR